MERKPKKMANILSETMLTQDFLGMPKTKSGKNRVISSWIRQGLKYVEVSGQRYFFEGDLVDFFWKKYRGMGK
jgi:hypothetical protein